MSTIPAFERGVRVALVERQDRPGMLGVAMAGGHYVVPLPEGFDGRTSVFYVDGWIVVRHPDQDPILADTSTGKTSPMNEYAMTAAMRAYEAPRATY